jgi:hypothetical protein
MKTLFTILISVFILSCRPSTPIICDNPAFIVSEIDEIAPGLCEYFSSNNGCGWNRNGFSQKPSIVLPSKMFNIGDTIKPSDFKK